MKKILIGLLTTSFISCSALAADIYLTYPNKLNPISLMHALNYRQSTKNFSNTPVDDQTLSSLLWAAYGINRTTGERTIPTAMNHKELSLYVIKKEGAYFYDANSHALRQITPNDLTGIFQTQEYMKNVPLILVWTSTNKNYGAMHAGSSYQNVSLFVAAHEMGAIVRGFFDKEKIKADLKLNPNDEVLISMAVGYPQENSDTPEKDENNTQESPTTPPAPTLSADKEIAPSKTTEHTNDHPIPSSTMNHQTNAPTAEAKPTETASTPTAEAKPTETAPTPTAEAKPTEPASTPTAKVKPAEPTSTPTAETKPAEPTSTPTAEAKPTETASTPTAETKPAEPASTPTAEAKPTETAPTPTAEAKPTEPASTPTAEAKPTETAPTPTAEAKPTETAPTPTAETKPTEPAPTPTTEAKPTKPSITPSQSQK